MTDCERLAIESLVHLSDKVAIGKITANEYLDRVAEIINIVRPTSNPA